MQSSGVKVDPVTGRPLEEVQKVAAAVNEKKAETILQEQAAWFNVSQSEAGRKLIALVEKQLEARIEALIEADPEAFAMVRILREMGIKEGIAHAATEQLHDRYIRKQEIG